MVSLIGSCDSAWAKAPPAIASPAHVAAANVERRILRTPCVFAYWPTAFFTAFDSPRHTKQFSTAYLSFQYLFLFFVVFVLVFDGFCGFLPKNPQGRSGVRHDQPLDADPRRRPRPARLATRRRDHRPRDARRGQHAHPVDRRGPQRLGGNGAPERAAAFRRGTCAQGTWRGSAPAWLDR